MAVEEEESGVFVKDDHSGIYQIRNIKQDKKDREKSDTKKENPWWKIWTT